MEAEARLLEAFSSLPNATRAWAFPAATHDGVRISLQLSQRNLPANAQRKYLTSFLLNEAVLEAGEPDVSLPSEQTGVLLYAPSPSGRRALVVRAGGTDASAGAQRGVVCWEMGRQNRLIVEGLLRDVCALDCMGNLVPLNPTKSLVVHRSAGGMGPQPLPPLSRTVRQHASACLPSICAAALEVWDRSRCLP